MECAEKIYSEIKWRPLDWSSTKTRARKYGRFTTTLWPCGRSDWINNFWKAIANDPATLKRTWEDIKQIMAPGALDPLTKELIYVAVSVSNQCDYCIASHTVSAGNKGMTDEMFKELMAVVGMANETNRLSAGYQVEIDEQFKAVVSRWPFVVGWASAEGIRLLSRLAAIFTRGNLNSCCFISTRRPRKATPSACRRSRCSIAESPRSLISPPAPSTLCQGRSKERRSAPTTCLAAPGYPAARATAP